MFPMPDTTSLHPPASRPPAPKTARLVRASFGLAAAALLVALPDARAQVVVSEGFDYPAGQPLAGQNGGTGWAGPWTTTTGTVQVQAGSLPGPVASTGNSVAANGSGGGGYSFNRALATPIGGANATVWLSLLMRGPTTVPSFSPSQSGPFDGLTMFGITGIHFGAFPTDFSGTQCVYGIGYDNLGVIVRNVTATPGSMQVLLVGRITYGGPQGVNVADLFVNPPVGGAVPTTPDATVSFGNTLNQLGPITQVLLTGANQASDLLDEIRIGPTFASVTPVPVPEPSALALAGIALTAGGAARRGLRRW
jgi:hypothetical protein